MAHATVPTNEDIKTTALIILLIDQSRRLRDALEKIANLDGGASGAIASKALLETCDY
jgi:hypothetical protein